MRTPGRVDAAVAAISAPDADDRVGGLDIGMEIAIVVEMRHRRAQPRPRGLERRARAQRRMEVAALRRGEQLDADDRACAFSAIVSRRRAPCAAIETWSS